MYRTQIFQVIRNRIQFKCPACGSRRNVFIPHGVVRKKIRCLKCDEMIRCSLNRRDGRRERLTGKVTMHTQRGEEIEVLLCDKSPGGAAFDVTLPDLRRHRLKPGQKVQFSCKWNPGLLANNKYEIANIHNQRIGVKKIKIG